jgi:hypothetical protein
MTPKAVEKRDLLVCAPGEGAKHAAQRWHQTRVSGVGPAMRVNWVEGGATMSLRPTLQGDFDDR